jgi:hypothetical protein
MLKPRVVRHWGGPVSCWVMRLQFKLTGFLAVLFTLGLCAGVSALAQDSSSSSQSQPTPPPSVQTPDSQAPNYGVYVATDPLAKVRYDNRWDVSLAPGYDHMKAGPTLLQGANLGGLDLNGSFWLSHHFALEGSGRAYVGTSGTQPNDLNGNGGDLEGPMVKQYFFVGGIEALGPHNKHGALIAHAMFGGVYGNFQKDLLNQPAGDFGFYSNQLAPAAIVGGHMDLNRSDRWVFRITPDAIMTHYTFQPPRPVGSSTLPPSYSQFDVNFAISVGLEYKFTGIKRSKKPGNWASGW